MVTAVLFTVGKYLIGLYLGHATLGSAYGAAGSLSCCSSGCILVPNPAVRGGVHACLRRDPRDRAVPDSRDPGLIGSDTNGSRPAPVVRLDRPRGDWHAGCVPCGTTPVAFEDRTMIDTPPTDGNRQALEHPRPRADADRVGVRDRRRRPAAYHPAVPNAPGRGKRGHSSDRVGTGVHGVRRRRRRPSASCSWSSPCPS